VLIESAWFDPVTVARSARRHKLSTEASRRYERGVDTDLADRAAELAARLLVEHGGGAADGGVTDVDERLPRQPVRMRADLPARLTGMDLRDEQVDDALRAVGCEVERAGEDLVVCPPSWRPDLAEGADLVEEVARVVGYEHITGVLPQAPAGRGLTREQRLRRSAARLLAGQGLVEVLTYPFVPEGRRDELQLPADDARRRALRLANPLSEQAPSLRTSLLETLVDAARRNLSRGARDLGLFEIGRVFRPDGTVPVPVAVPEPGVRPDDDTLDQLRASVPAQPLRAAVLLAGAREPAGWWGTGRLADWADAVEVAQTVTRALSVPVTVRQDEHAPWHPGRCARLELSDGTLLGHAGELAPAVVSALELPERTCVAEIDLDVLIAAAPQVVRARPLSTFPVALRDVALVVPVDVPAARVEAALREGAGELLEEVRLFDEYRGAQVGQGLRSLAYRLALRAPDRTLTGDEATAARDAAVRRAAELTGAELRAG
jgi:phenylalanyl-tRNA synthetase beta chain